MKRRLLLTLFFVPFFLSAQVQDMVNYRLISGMYNNLDNPSWGAAHTDLLQFTTIGFSDGYGSVGGQNRPNPREVSNSLFSQSGVLNDNFGLSDFVWAWGQFLDHDIGLTTDGEEPLIIEVPAGDPHFDPFGTGEVVIPMHRNAIAPGSGTGINNPRRYVNEITAFIDGSGVYGSDLPRADWLRTFSEGKLKVSVGNRLPYNTTSGEFTDPIDPDAPHMENPTGISEIISVAGDPRAGENPLLESLHIIFVREHNRQCDLILKDHPDWTDEEVYQHARKIVGGLIQSIVYDEWLPILGINLPPYSGYNAQRHPQLMNVFTAAAFRLGHTMLTTNLQRLDNDGNVIPQGNMLLRDAFFNPFAIQETGGIDPFLKGMAAQMQQLFDAKVIDDVRNFLFGPPGAGGLDLAAININRGRERGLPDFNTIREDFGLPAYNFFQQINPSAAVFTRLLSLYADIDEIDPWVGMLAERPLPGTIFGPTLREIITQQFLALRNGDRFYYLNDPILSAEEKDYILRTSFRDIIMYNTDINLMQDNVFVMRSQEEICENMSYDLAGWVRTSEGEAVPGVTMALSTTNGLSNELTPAEGTYAFPEMPYCDLQSLSPNKNDNPINGVSTFDIIQIQKHILGVDPFTDPYQLIAADINASGTITTIDLIRLRKLILGIDTDFGDNTSWRFVFAAFEFPEDENPLSVAFPEILDFDLERVEDFNEGFIAVKVGDVNGSVNLNNIDDGDERFLAMGVELSFLDDQLEEGEEYVFEIELESQAPVQGLQFSIDFSNIELVDVEVSSWDPEYYNATISEFRFSYNSNNVDWLSGTMAFRVKALGSGSLRDFLALGRALPSESYNAADEALAVRLLPKTSNMSFWVGQNEPNPFEDITRIPFELEQAGEVQLAIYTTDGKLVYQAKEEKRAGKHYWELRRQDIGISGLYYYELECDAGMKTRSLVLQ